MEPKRLITVLMLAALAACGKDDPKREAMPAPSSATAPSAPSTEPTGSRPMPAVADAPSSASAAQNASGASTYKVKRGDTLVKIARAHGVKYSDLARWNGIDDPNRLLVGQELRVVPLEPASQR